MIFSFRLNCWFFVRFFDFTPCSIVQLLCDIVHYSWFQSVRYFLAKDFCWRLAWFERCITSDRWVTGIQNIEWANCVRLAVEFEDRIKQNLPSSREVRYDLHHSHNCIIRHIFTFQMIIVDFELVQHVAATNWKEIFEKICLHCVGRQNLLENIAQIIDMSGSIIFQIIFVFEHIQTSIDRESIWDRGWTIFILKD